MIKNFVFSLILFCNAIYSVSSVPVDPHRKIEHMVRQHGYPFEKHLVETEDGYTIEIHRIPSGKSEKANQASANKPPVYVLNAFYQSSATWVATGPRISIAYLLADKGFDVWLGNCRGNIYARNHTTYIEQSFGFWDFSWHEIGIYDMPATIDLILKKTGKSQLYFTCHSQGCTAAYVLGALKPEYNDKIRFAAHMGPIAFLGNIKGIGRVFAPLLAEFGTPLAEKIGHFDMTGNALITILFRQVLMIQPLFFIIFNAIYTFTGPSRVSDNQEAIENAIAYVLAGSSTKQVLHYAQGVRNPYTFRQYDYGMVQNLITYKSIEPPDYPLEKVTTPIAIIQGTNDFCANDLDLDFLVTKLPNVVGRFKYPLNHLDFGYHRNMRQLGYNKILELFQKSERGAL